MGYHLHSQNKTPEPTTRDHSQCYWLRRLTLWPSSMSRIISDLQSRQYTGRCCALVCGVTLSSRLFRLQIGQDTHPSATLIIPQSLFLINRSPPFLFHVSRKYTWFQVQINIRKFSFLPNIQVCNRTDTDNRTIPSANPHCA